MKSMDNFYLLDVLEWYLEIKINVRYVQLVCKK